LSLIPQARVVPSISLLSCNLFLCAFFLFKFSKPLQESREVKALSIEGMSLTLIVILLRPQYFPETGQELAK
jgi:hypothetical protein